MIRVRTSELLLSARAAVTEACRGHDCGANVGSMTIGSRKRVDNGTVAASGTINANAKSAIGAAISTTLTPT